MRGGETCSLILGLTVPLVTWIKFLSIEEEVESLEIRATRTAAESMHQNQRTHLEVTMRGSNASRKSDC
jgi:hypothetical protein